MLMFDDKVGGWGWPNAEVSKKVTKIYPRTKIVLGEVGVSLP